MKHQEIETAPAWLTDAEAFTRTDETDDGRFYQKDRFVNHLDDTARSTVERLIGRLAPQNHPRVLDLMAGWDSHLPPGLAAEEVVGLGMNENELRANSTLTRRVIHDLNRDPELPFEDGEFDLVLNTVSVDYMTQPLAVFGEVARILKPGGLFLVIFSNRMFPTKAVKIWREAEEEDRVKLVREYFALTGGFATPEEFVSKGKPRPKTDKYAKYGLPSDPIYAVHARRAG
jgi:SAM-dependent methyltransferase